MAFVITTVVAARSFIVCLQSEVMLIIIIFVLAISLLQTECLLDAFLPGMRGYVCIDISLLDRVDLRRRAQVGTHEHLLMRANLTQKVVVKSDLVQLCNLVNPLVALVEFGALFHQDLERLVEPQYFKELEVLLRQLFPLKLGYQARQNFVFFEFLVRLARDWLGFVV